MSLSSHTLQVSVYGWGVVGTGAASQYGSEEVIHFSQLKVQPEFTSGWENDVAPKLYKVLKKFPPIAVNS